MKFVREKPDNTVDLTELYYKFMQQYNNVFMAQIDDQVFLYHTIGRKTWNEIVSNEDLKNYQKEELVCQKTVLYPENFDWTECDAGLPTQLCAKIIKNSLLDSIDVRDNITTYYRNEMFDIDHQITCIINEAFPNIPIEEIEDWDIDKTTKYYSRAEWKLHNFKGIPFDTSKTFSEMVADYNGDSNVSAPVENTTEEENITTEIEPKLSKQPKSQPKINHRGGEKRALSLEELAAKYGGDFAIAQHDDGLDGIDGLAQESIDTTPPALRENWGF